MANILVVTYHVPQLHALGGQIRLYGLLRQLAGVHNFTVITGVRDGEENAVADLSAFCVVHALPVSSLAAKEAGPGRSRARRIARRAGNMPARRPQLLRSKDSFCRLAAQAISDLSRHGGFDLIQIEQIDLVPIQGLIAGTVPVVASMYDVHAEVYGSYFRQQRTWYWILYHGLELIKVIMAERALVRRPAGLMTVSERDMSALRYYSRRLRVCTVRNAIDVKALHTGKRTEDDRPILVFVGTMDFAPNVDAMLWFRAETWPLVRDAMPNLSLYIVGSSPTQEIRNLDRHAGIHVTGRVDSIIPILSSARVFINPMRLGGGTNLKMLYAMATATPIVTTRKGARGLHVVHDKHVLLADSPRELACSILRLLGDRRLAQRLGLAARAVAERDYDIELAARALHGFYEDVLGRKAGRSGEPDC